MRTEVLSLATLAALLGAAATPSPKCAEGVTREASAVPTSPNYCVALAPTPSLDSVAAILELQPAPSPFGAAVTRDGLPRYRLFTTIAGLPDPSALGPYRTYVAWAYTLAMDSAIDLGEVRNGRTDLGELARDQFRLVITAESSATVTSRSGRIVLRGTSPASRTLMHRDFTTAFNPGVTAGAMMPGMNVPPGARSRGMSPSDGVDARALPEARVSESVTLRSGDTITLVAAPVRRTIAGHTLVLYGFNGRFPGPTLRVTQGSTITVRFRNAIPMPTAIHWHGVRVENRFDGAIGVTQAAVPPGGEFTYRVRFLDAGLFWYHAHEREDIQVASGLFGNIVVEPEWQHVYAGLPREELLTLSSLTLGPEGIDPYGATSPNYALMGRYGDLLLVNGAPRYSLRVPRGEVVRFLITNASSARVYNLSFAGARMTVVGSDLGIFEHRRVVEDIVIAPAERYVVDVRFDLAGASLLTNRVQALDHPSGTIYPEVDTLGVVTVTADRTTSTASEGRGIPHISLQNFLPYRDSAPAHLLVLGMRVHGLPAATMNMLNGVSLPVDWNDGLGAMNREATGREVEWVLRDPETGLENMAIDWHFHVGDIVKVRVYNDPGDPHPMDHSLHVHGQEMLLLARNGVPAEDLVLKDTILIPAGEVDDILIRIVNPGRWMLHCHIAEHRTAGMMMAFQVDSI